VGGLRRGGPRCRDRRRRRSLLRHGLARRRRRSSRHGIAAGRGAIAAGGTEPTELRVLQVEPLQQLVVRRLGARRELACACSELDAVGKAGIAASQDGVQWLSTMSTSLTFQS